MMTNRTPCVTQAARDNASCIYGIFRDFYNAKAAKEGRCDDGVVVQAFARFEAEIRQSAEAASRDLVAEMSDTIRTLQNELQAHKDALAQWEGGHDPEPLL